MTKKGIFEEVMGAVDENLPAILTFASAILAVGTTGYSIWAGAKIKEVLDDPDLDQKTKIRKIVLLLLPAIGGAAGAVTCTVSAHKEHTSRYVGLAGLYAATKLDKEKLEDKAKEIIGVEKVEEIKAEIVKDDVREKCASLGPSLDLDHEITIHDLVTGYVFKTTLVDFFRVASEFNNMLGYERMDIGSFYEMLLGHEYTEAKAHEYFTFGLGSEVAGFNPTLDIELSSDMYPVYTIEYRYDDKLW